MVDFTPPFYTTGLSAVYIKNTTIIEPFNFLKPFCDSLWVTIFASAIAYGLFLYLAALLGDDAQQKREPLSLWRCLAIIGHALIQQEGDFKPRVLGERIIMVTWRVYSLIIIATYTANFTAFLSVSFKENGLKTFDEMVELLHDPNSKFRYGVERKTSNYDFFKHSNHSKFREAYKQMEEWGTLYPASTDIQQSLDRLNKTSALITDEITIDLMKNENCEKNIYSVRPINFEEQAFAMRRGLPQKDEINKKIREYGRNGILTKLLSKHTQPCKPKQTDHRVGVARLMGYFHIMSVAAGCALISPWIVSWNMTKIKIIKYVS